MLTEKDTACDYANGRGFESYPIHGILCDGESFEFFLFDGSTNPPTFSQGVFSHTSPSGVTYTRRLILASLVNPSASTSANFIRTLRPVCETIFAFLLSGYRIGLLAYYHRSVSQRGSCIWNNNTSAWQQAYSLAESASDLAVVAAAEAEAGEIRAANEAVKTAFDILQKRFVLHRNNFKNHLAYSDPLPASILSLRHTNATSGIFYLGGIQRKLKSID
jgi:hypothetical protein